MRRIDIINRAGRNLRRAKLRTILTSLAISVGAFTIMLSMAIGSGTRAYIDRAIFSNADPQSVAISKDSRMFSVNGVNDYVKLTEYSEDSMTSYGVNFSSLTQADIDKIGKNPKVKHVRADYQFQAKYVELSVKPGKKYIGQVQTYEETLIKETAAGKFPPMGQQLKDDEVVVPESYLPTLDVKNPADIIGTTVKITIAKPQQKVTQQQINDARSAGGEAAVEKLLTEAVGGEESRELKVVAVLGKNPQSTMTIESIYVSANTSRQLSEASTKGTDQYQKYLSAVAVVKEGHDVNDFKAEVEKQGYIAMTMEDLQSMLFSFVNVMQNIVIGFGLLALVVSIFGIINTQYISVLERTQQIGLMKALGASRRDVGKMFRYEAAWVGFLGGVLGVGAAWGLGTALNPLITTQLNLGEGNSLLIFQPLSAVGIVLLLMVVAIIAGFFPSRKAAKLDPIEALRTE